MPSQDSVYKSLFSQPEVLESLLRYYGPAELSDMLDFNSLEYVVLIWQKLLRQDKTTKTLPAVLPILLHTGSHPFSRPTRVSELMGIYPSFLAKFQPQFEFCLETEQIQPRF